MKTYKLKINMILHTNGKGWWSRTAKSVRCTNLEIETDIDELADAFYLLNIYFDRRTWKTDLHGLIYTDSLFLKELKKNLKKLGFNSDGIGYSEQGMQGDNFVNLDADEAFYHSYLRLKK